MKTKAIKLMRIIVLVQIVLLCLFIESDRRPHNVTNHVQSETGSGSEQTALDSGNRLASGMPDVLPAAESRNVSSIRTGRPEEESVLIFFNLFLVFSMLLFLPDGRVWSAIQSVSMAFRSYAMHQIRILQLRDGKKKGFFYS